MEYKRVGLVPGIIIFLLCKLLSSLLFDAKDEDIVTGIIQSNVL